MFNSQQEIFTEQYQRVLHKQLTENTATSLGVEIMSLDDFWVDEKKQGDLVDVNVKSVEEAEGDQPEDLLDLGKDADIAKMADPEERERQAKKPIASRTNKLLHNSTIKGLVDEDGKEITDEGLEKLKQIMIKRPDTLLKQNAKMKKSKGTGKQLYNFNLPAYQGLFFNEKTDSFQVVKTCPSASECVAFCYATKGGYIQYPASAESASKIITFLMNDFRGFFTLLMKDLSKAEKAAKKVGDKLYIRVHDAGDFFSEPYIRAWKHVMEQFPDINFYAYTKQHRMVKSVMGELPSNFTLNLSQGGLHDKDIDFTKDKHSRVIPKELFGDLNMKEKGKGDDKIVSITPEDLNTLKDRIAEKLGIDRGSILSYNEMLQKEEGTEPYWNVIIMPGEGDLSATRKDVLGTLLLIH